LGFGGWRGRAIWLDKVTKYVVLSLEILKYTQEVETGVTERKMI
jgi:hypothetical protein